LKNIDKKEINETFNDNKVNFKNEIIKSYDNTKKDLFNILNKKIEEIYKEYLQSEEFKNSIKKLVEEGNFFDYIKDYIEAAEQVVEYYKKRCYKKKK
jgi:tRNA(Glu) U13 pseudouridine synthase TruD